MLKSALDNELNQHLARIFLLLSFINDPQTTIQIGNTLQLTANNSTKPASAEKRAYALEIFEMLVPAQMKAVLLPLIDDLTPGQRLQHLSRLFPQGSSAPEQRVQEIINGSEAWFSPWTKTCALQAIAQLSASNDLSEAVISVLYSTSVPLVKEMAVWTLYKIAPERLEDYARELGRDPDPQVRKITNWLTTKQRGKRLMLSLIEKVIFLKAVNLFSQTPEEVLAELAAVLEELEIQAGETVIEKDQPGSSLYIIIDGQVQVHDGGEILKTMGARDVFGELSILDPGPRAASVTAIETTRLLRLDQEPFYELIDDHSVVARRIMQILVRQLRFAYAQAQVNRPADNLLHQVQHHPTQS